MCAGWQLAGRRGLVRPRRGRRCLARRLRLRAGPGAVRAAQAQPRRRGRQVLGRGLQPPQQDVLHRTREYRILLFCQSDRASHLSHARASHLSHVSVSLHSTCSAVAASVCRAGVRAHDLLGAHDDEQHVRRLLPRAPRHHVQTRRLKEEEGAHSRHAGLPALLSPVLPSSCLCSLPRPRKSSLRQSLMIVCGSRVVRTDPRHGEEARHRQVRPIAFPSLPALCSDCVLVERVCDFWACP